MSHLSYIKHTDLDKLCRDYRQLSLCAGQPQGLDDVVAAGQLGMQHEVVGHGA